MTTLKAAEASLTLPLTPKGDVEISNLVDALDLAPLSLLRIKDTLLLSTTLWGSLDLAADPIFEASSSTYFPNWNKLVADFINKSPQLLLDSRLRWKKVSRDIARRPENLLPSQGVKLETLVYPYKVSRAALDFLAGAPPSLVTHLLNFN